MKVPKDTIKVEIKLLGKTYSLGSTQYTIDTQGNVLMGGATITDEDKKKLVEMNMRMALNRLAEDLAKDLAKFMKETYADEIKQATRKFVKENKESLMKVVMDEVAKDAEAALERLYKDDRY